jgi:hypothetical protein
MRDACKRTRMERDVNACRAVNRRLDELNGYLVEANVEPVPKLEDGTLVSERVATPTRLRETLDYLDIPAHADARVDVLLHDVLNRLAGIEQ